VALKATSDIEINGKIIEKGETIALFDKIQFANFQEVKSIVTANGGFDNRTRVIWERTREVDLSFTQGVFSKVQFALLSNSRMLNIEPGSSVVYVPKREMIESNERGEILLSKAPTDKKRIFAYDENGNKVAGTIDGRTIIPLIGKPYTNYEVDYYYEYDNGVTAVTIGQRLIEGFIRLEGKTRFKDDKTGKEVTGLIEIPKLKLVSGLSITLGKDASPIVPRFQAIGYPVGAKGSEVIVQFTFLNDDIDSDIQ
jgi:hypothetical protein